MVFYSCSFLPLAKQMILQMVTGPKGMAVMISQGVSGTAASLSLSDDGENYRVKANIILLEWSIFGRQKQNFKGGGIQIFSCRWSKHFQVDRSKIYVERRKQKFAGKQKQQFSGGQKKINSENTDYRKKHFGANGAKKVQGKHVLKTTPNIFREATE